EEVIDKTPIAADDKIPGQDDDFGGFDDEEDEKYMERAKRNAMRKRGLDPKALKKPTANGSAEKSEAKSETKGEANKEKSEEKSKSKAATKSEGKTKSKKKT
ncbi:hypothetical protein PC116_g32780, partial [Phytophthora cactorum]